MGRIYITVPDAEEERIDDDAEAAGFKDRSKFIFSLIEKHREEKKKMDSTPALTGVPALPAPYQVKVSDTPQKRRRIVKEAYELWKQADPGKEPTNKQVARVLEALYGEHGVIGGLALWMVNDVMGEMTQIA